MTAAVLSDKLAEINQQITALENERKNLVWNEGVPALTAKMKQMGKTVIELREAERQGYFETEDLWGDFEGEDGSGYYAVKKLLLDENEDLIVIHNTIWNQVESYERMWDYDDDDMSCIVNKKFSDCILTKIIDTLLTKDEIYDIICQNEDDNRGLCQELPAG